MRRILIDDVLYGIPTEVSPMLPSELPVMSFDPAGKCTWATSQFRRQMNAWLVERFGMQQVAFLMDTSLLTGSPDGRMLAMHPKHAGMLRELYARRPR
jgi:hypothetical protein